MSSSSSAIIQSPVERFYSNAYLYSCLCDRSLSKGVISLICEYVDSHTSGSGKAAFQKRYAERNKEPEKIQPLRVVHIIDDSDKYIITHSLAEWQHTCKERISTYGADKTRSTHEACLSITSKICRTIIGPTYGVSKVVDASETMHGVCLTRDLSAGKREIVQLVSSPHNIRCATNHATRIEGAGTALIEDTIIRVVQATGNQDIEIHLFALLDAYTFYTKRHFTRSYGIGYTHYLKGDNLLSFMRDFAGRAGSA